MKKSTPLLPLSLVVALLPPLFGCGGGANSQPAGVVVSIPEDSVTLGAAESHQFTVTVTGHSNTSVSWSLAECTGDACGTISSTGLYTAPPIIPNQAMVIVRATSQADPAKFDAAKVQHMPIEVSIAPPSAWVAPGKAAEFTAVVRYDGRNAGVSWSLPPACSSATCGSLGNVAQNSVSYTAPSSASNSPVKLTATSVTDPNKSADVTITISTGHGLNEGDYVFSFNGWETPINNGFYWMYSVAAAGRFHADSNGNITEGVEDINRDSGVTQSLNFTGTYSVGPERRGNFTIVSAQGTSSYHMIVDPSATKGRFIKYDGLPTSGPISGTGFFELQDKSALSLSRLAGPYAFAMLGTVNGPNRVATVGALTAGTTGTFTGGNADMTRQSHVGTQPQANFLNLTLTGSFGAPSPVAGRGTTTMKLSPIADGTADTFNFAYYVISYEKIIMVEIDRRDETTPVLSGELRRQNGPFSPSSFNAASIFSMTGANRREYAPALVDVFVGQLVPDGIGSLMGILDDNHVASNRGITGSYTVARNGRTTMTFTLGLGPSIAYLYGPNEGFLMDTSGTDVWFGRMKPQFGVPFSAASISETFLTATTIPPSEYTENCAGMTTFDGVGGFTSTLDTNSWANLNHYELKGTYTVASNGRGTLTFASSNSAAPMVFWMISPTELVGIGALHPSAASTDSPNFAANLLEFEKEQP